MRSIFKISFICFCIIGLLGQVVAFSQWYIEEKALFSWNYENGNIEYKVYISTPNKSNPVLIYTTTEKSYTYIPNQEGTWIFGVQPIDITTGSEAPICWSDDESCTKLNTFQLKVQAHPQQGNRWKIIWK